MHEGLESSVKLDVTGALGPAWDRMKLILFQPFEAGKWLSIGLMVFMEILVQGSGGNYNYSGRGTGGSGSSGPSGMPSSPAEVADLVDEGFRWVGSNLELVLLGGIPIVLLLLGLYVLFLWLSSRGQLMLVRTVARNDARLGDNWRATRFLVGSLFKFRLVLEAITMFVVLSGLGSLLYVLYRLLRRNETDWKAYLFELGPIALAWFVVSLLPGMVSSVLRNFVAPLMLHFQETCSESWRRFLPVLKSNVGAVVVFFILRALMHFAFGIANIFVVLLTCCIGALPVVNQAITAPFYVFDRAWSMFALRSIGRDYDLFIEPAAPAPSIRP